MAPGVGHLKYARYTADYGVLGAYNISSPFRHNRKPLIFQWALTLGNAGIGSVSIPAFHSVNAH